MAGCLYKKISVCWGTDEHSMTFVWAIGEAYNAATTAFIDNNHITYRLAKIRSIINEPFDPSLGDDDMDDIERRICQIEFWKPDKDT